MLVTWTNASSHAHGEIAACPGCVERLERAIGLYRGEFLQGLFLEKSQPFEEWLRYNREKFSFRAMRALHILTGVYLRAVFPSRPSSMPRDSWRWNPGVRKLTAR